MEPAAAQAVLMYFVLPAWLAVGFADYLFASIALSLACA
jgi:hypothetical protein